MLMEVELDTMKNTQQSSISGDEESQGLVRNKVAEHARQRNVAAPRCTRIRPWRTALFGLTVVFFAVGALIIWSTRPSTTETASFEGSYSDDLEAENGESQPSLPFLQDDDPLTKLVARVETSPVPGNDELSENDPTTAEGVSLNNASKMASNGSMADDEAEDLKNALFSTKLQVEECQKLKVSKRFTDKNSFEYKLASANCGWDYDYANPPSKTEPWSVVLFGMRWTSNVLGLSGCLVKEAKCPSAPMCNITVANDVHTVSRADVIVAYQEDAEHSIERLQRNFPKVKRQYRVLYFREGHTAHPIATIQEKYEFEMGVHFYAELYNPTYMRRPSELLSASIPPYPPIPLIPLQEKTKFAMWAISDCGAESNRDQYIARMTRVLGPERVHGYGRCGHRKLPPKPINNAAKLISEYKFYLSFENIIQHGYVSEKLLWILTIPVVPVYFGPSNVPNITTVPSYINVAHFKTPEAVAHYLLHLDTNPDEYNKYHQWRDKSGKYFAEDYLDAIRYKLAGPEEVLQFSDDAFAPQRSAQCCRLCDKRYVQWAVHERQRNKKSGISRVTDMTKSNLYAKFFGG